MAKGVSEGVISLPSEDSVVDMYEYAVEKLEQEGLCRLRDFEFCSTVFKQHNLLVTGLVVLILELELELILD